MNHFFKVFIEFVTVLLLLYVLVFWPRSRWDLSSPPAMELAHPAWEGEILTAGLPGRSLGFSLSFIPCTLLANIL